jgi:glycosyltransferase involved in cell wall biosynthesis
VTALRSQDDWGSGSASIDISVIICTFNRADVLSDTLESYAGMEFPADGGAELLIVDNNSTDATARIARAWVERLPHPARYVFEAQSGLSYARNTGIRQARGAVVAFADDDIYFDRRWLVQLLRVFREHPDAMAAGGRSEPLFEASPPSWLTMNMIVCYGSTNSGDQVRTMSYPEHPFGLNMAFRRETLVATGGFNTGLGRRKQSLLSNEESDVFFRLHERGMRVVYTPHAVVQHRIPASRTQKKWLLRRYFWQGMSDVALRQIHGKRPRVQLLRESWWELRSVVQAVTGGFFLPTRIYVHVRSRNVSDWAEYLYRLGVIRQSLREVLGRTR